MKLKGIVLASAIIVSVSSFAQKDELKKLKKIYGRNILSSSDIQDYKENLTQLESMATEEGDKVYANFYKTMLPLLEVKSAGKEVTPVLFANAYSPAAVNRLAEGLNATLNYEKSLGKKTYTDDIQETIHSIKPQLFNFAVSLGEKKNFSGSSLMFYSIYLMDNSDKEMLYYAASYAVNAKDYDKALDFYTQLKNMNYTGEGTIYWATNKASGTEESFPSVAKRKQFIDLGTHENPRDEKIVSKKGEIYRNIALILKEQGKTEEAISGLSEAIKVTPNDISLIVVQAEVFLKMEDYKRFNELAERSISQNPNSADLNFNFGVLTANANKVEDAEKFYKKTLEADSNYVGAYLNLANLKLSADEKWVNEMNKLGMSPAENKRYEEIKLLRNNNFKSVLPYLEKATELKPEDEEVQRVLLSVYNALEMRDKYKELKAKMK